MKDLLHARPVKTGKFILLLIIFSLLAFVVSTLTTTRILRRVSVVEVPDLAGKSVETARSMLRVSRLSLDIVEFRFDQRLPANQIITQDPPPNNSVKSGRIVRVVVSRGSQAINLPDLTGASLREASVSLGKKSLNPGRISLLYTNAAPKNTILAQWPMAGEYGNQGSRVNLLASAGPRPQRWVLPDFKGMMLPEATRVLKHIGLELQDIRRQVDDGQNSDTILGHKPAAGELVGYGSRVSLLVSRRSADRKADHRLVNIKYHVPTGDLQVRVKMVVLDDNGRREIYNAMERPNADVILRTTLQGSKATLNIFINGSLIEERSL